MKAYTEKQKKWLITKIEKWVIADCEKELKEVGDPFLLPKAPRPTQKIFHQIQLLEGEIQRGKKRLIIINKNQDKSYKERIQILDALDKELFDF